MRISDWSSDVCSSDLQVRTLAGRQGLVRAVDGRHVEVVFPEGSETLDIDDLTLANLSPVENLMAGELGDTEAFALRLQSLYLCHAYRFDDRAGLSNARIEPNLHQIYIAHLVTNKVQPRMILADEVGLGKTIEAGLILKELRARGVADRVLVAGPPALQSLGRACGRERVGRYVESPGVGRSLT